MPSKYRDTFFASKRHWSIYKDSVLDYYLVPYLEKVKKLGKPVVVIDMFAGQGRFDSGEDGSPLLIARRLDKLAKQGHKVSQVCYEQHTPFSTKLKDSLSMYSFATVVNDDCFKSTFQNEEIGVTVCR